MKNETCCTTELLGLWTCVSTRGDYRAHTDDDNAKKTSTPQVSYYQFVESSQNADKKLFFELGFLFQYISVCGATAARFRES